jgi:two-component system, chemotaxis family, response regulator PixG
MNLELNPSQLLIQLSSSQSTGCLELVYGSVCWNIFLRFGKLIAADCSIQSGDRSIDWLLQRGYERAANALKAEPVNPARLMRHEIERMGVAGLLDRDQLYRISTDLTKEAFESMLWLTDGKMTWHPDRAMSVTTGINHHSHVKLAQIVDYYEQRLAIWQRFNDVVRSPHQRPYLTNQTFLGKPVAGGTLSPTALVQIVRLMKGASLRELAIFLKQDELKLVKLLAPYIRHNAICLREPSPPLNDLPHIPTLIIAPIPVSAELTAIVEDNQKVAEPVAIESTSTAKVYQIACVEDLMAISEEMDKILGNKEKYHLTKFDDSTQATDTISRLKPDLILLDVTTPNIDGYKLCSAFRNSETLAETPIIMVTGNQSFLDRARARMFGVNDCLTKPFSESELLATVDKYLPTVN